MLRRSFCTPQPSCVQRYGSMPRGGSSQMTSAPFSANSSPAKGPAVETADTTTRTPWRFPKEGISSRLTMIELLCDIGARAAPPRAARDGMRYAT